MDEENKKKPLVLIIILLIVAITALFAYSLIVFHEPKAIWAWFAESTLNPPTPVGAWLTDSEGRVAFQEYTLELIDGYWTQVPIKNDNKNINSSQHTGTQNENDQTNVTTSTYSNDNTPPLDTAGPSNSNEQMIYRVRVGPYTSRSNSEEASKDLSSLGYPVSIVNDGGYYVQIGAFSIEENAEKLKQEAISRGFEVIVTPSSSNKAEFAVEEPIENRQIVNALDYFPLFDNRRYIAPSGNGSYVFGFANIVKINGVSYIKYGEDPLFTWGFYDPDYTLYSLIDYDGITWICSMGVGKNGELEMKPSPFKVMPLNIEIGKEYMAGVQKLPGLNNYTFFLQDTTTSDGVIIKDCLIREDRYGYGSSDRDAQCYFFYVRDRGCFTAGTIPPDKGIEWSGNPAAFKDSVPNRNYLRSFEDNKEQKEIDAKLMDILRTIKSYYKFGDIQEIFGAEPYYSTPYESGIFGYGGVAFWRFNGREVMINFKKSDYVDHIIVDEGSFYMKNF